MPPFFRIWLVLLVPFFAAASDLFLNTKAVQDLSGEQFEAVIVGEAPWVLMLYSPYCGHCRNYAPKWIQFAEALTETVAQQYPGSRLNVGAVDCIANK
ncbi:unnamed protein product, partial [Chrysoparadoxa australica]